LIWVPETQDVTKKTHICRFALKGMLVIIILVD
jgi:hypothetical protein